MAPRRFLLDSSYRRPRRGRTVIGGSPLRLFTLSEEGVRVMVAIEDGDELPAGHERLTDRLVDRGVLHPVLPAPPAHPHRVLTVVVPAHRDRPLFQPRACRTIVVDDASPHPITMSPDTAVEVIRLPVNRGPGGARNAGLALVDTELVAFVDTDVEIAEGDLVRLLGHFDDPRVALVAPRICASNGGGVLAAFERRRSSLDGGTEPGRIAPTTRISFVPAAAMVCRTDVLREAGGFDETMRFGEDVDLVWRLVRTGHRCRYEPAVVGRHRVRPNLASWIAQRVGYGSSAASLAERHPGAVAPLRMSGWSAAAWTAVGAGFVRSGSVIGAGTAIALTHKLRSIPKSESLRLAATGHLFAGRVVATALTRAWWPIALALALISQRARRALALAVVVPVAVDWCSTRPELDPARYAALHVLDDAAYGAGVWLGVIHRRSGAALAPSFEAWPPSEPE